jgi:hypothetical protein
VIVMIFAVSDTVVAIASSFAGLAVALAASTFVLVLQERRQKALEEDRFAVGLMHHIDQAYRIGVQRAFESLQLAERYRAELEDADGGLQSGEQVLRDLEARVGPVPEELVRQVRTQWPQRERATR